MRLTFLVRDKCYDRGESIFYRGSPIWKLKTAPKNLLGEKMKQLPLDQQSHGLGAQRDSCEKLDHGFRRFWVKEPRHSETVSNENALLVLLLWHASKVLTHVMLLESVNRPAPVLHALGAISSNTISCKPIEQKYQ